MSKDRIWELDALRGAAVLGMVIVHLVYDLTELTGVVQLQLPGWYLLLKQYGGAVFVLISGVCAVLGTRSARRGLLVFSCGMLCTAVTLGIYLLGLSGRSFVIWFGALHCLGLCMLLWPPLKRLHPAVLLAAGTVLTAAGLWCGQRSFDVSPLLIPLGLVPDWFGTSDYFPLLPNLGFFLLGAGLGKLLYADRSSLLPRADTGFFPIRFLCAMGRSSLIIYLLHQPLLAGAAFGLSLLLS